MKFPNVGDIINIYTLNSTFTNVRVEEWDNDLGWVHIVEEATSPFGNQKYSNFINIKNIVSFTYGRLDKVMEENSRFIKTNDSKLVKIVSKEKEQENVVTREPKIVAIEPEEDLNISGDIVERALTLTELRQQQNNARKSLIKDFLGKEELQSKDTKWEKKYELPSFKKYTKAKTRPGP